MSFEYKKQTDEIQKITLESEITHADWRGKYSPVGEKATLTVWTHFVGNGSEIKITVQDKQGAVIENLSGKVHGEYFSGSLIIPDNAKDELTFTAKLQKHGLEKKSDILKIIPPVKVSNLKWGQAEARRGDIVKLTADIEGVPDETEVMLSIYEYDQDGAHDFITRFPCQVKSRKIEAEWEYEYHEDTDEIPTQEEKEKYGKSYNPPEYFFTVNVYSRVFGKNQESGLLEFKDWIEILLVDEDGKPRANRKYALDFSDGTRQEGTLDNEGKARIEDVPPGPYRLKLADEGYKSPKEQSFERMPLVGEERPREHALFGIKERVDTGPAADEDRKN